jgi:hypothetical protein
MAGALISTCIQAVILLPAVIFGRTFENDNPCTLAFSEGRLFGGWITLHYLFFFLLSAFMLIGNFAYFADCFFAGYIPRVMAVICCTAAAVYIGQMNISVIGKTAVFGVTGFVLLSVLAVTGSFKGFTLVNFHLAQENLSSSVLSAVKSEFVRNSNLAALVFLMPDLKDKYKSGKTLWLYLVIKIIIIELAAALAVIILGDFAQSTPIPFFSLTAYAHTQIVERYDAGFMFVWVIIGLTELSVYLHCAARCIGFLFPKSEGFHQILWAAAIPAVVALAVLIPHKWESLAFGERGVWQVLVPAVILPLAVLIICYKSRNGKEVVSVETKQKK